MYDNICFPISPHGCAVFPFRADIAPTSGHFGGEMKRYRVYATADVDAENIDDAREKIDAALGDLVPSFFHAINYHESVLPYTEVRTEFQSLPAEPSTPPAG